MITPAQTAIVKADILANPDLSAKPLNSDGAFAIAALYGAQAAPDFIVWKSKVHEQDIASLTSDEATTWSWTSFISRSQGERDGWARMFNGTYTVNPSLPQVRNAFIDIFSGTAGAAQRTHLQAICKRKATRIEKVLSTGTGSTATPAVMGYEGTISYQDIELARAS